MANSKTTSASKSVTPQQSAKAALKPPATAQSTSFTPWTTEQKREFGKQFSEKERASYHKGRQNAYQHAANMVGRQAKFVREQEG